MKNAFKKGLSVLMTYSFFVCFFSLKAQDVDIKLTILRVHQLDAVDGRYAGDFFARVKMGNRLFPNTGYRVNDADFNPNWTFQQRVHQNSRLPIIIEILDKDTDGDPNDICDINPTDRKKVLNIYYLPNTNRIGGDLRGNEDEVIHTRGGGDRNRLEIWFKITETRAEPPSPPAKAAGRRQPAPPIVAGNSDPGQPAPPVVSANRQPYLTCATCIGYVRNGSNEQRINVDIPCPQITEVVPAETHPGQWIRIQGDWFGPFPDRVTPCREPVHKMVVVSRFLEDSRDAAPASTRLTVSEWSEDHILAWLPESMPPGRYHLSINLQQDSGNHIYYVEIGNRAVVRVIR